MFIIVEERAFVTRAYTSGFGQEGVCATGLDVAAFDEWVVMATQADMDAVEAFLIGVCPDREAVARAIRLRSAAPLIALDEAPSLEQTLKLFAAGVDDVVRKPVHVRELLARAGAIGRRQPQRTAHVMVGDMRISFDGQDPEIRGVILALPRRERRILEYLGNHSGRWVSRAQMFRAIYGLFEEEAGEALVESHVSKLRKKLRVALGYDPIEARRYLGYCLRDTIMDTAAA